MSPHVPILIIGAGPLGLELAVAIKRHGLAYRHLEAGQIGATIQWWSPGTRWFSSAERIAIAGVPLITPAQEKASREEYLAYLRTVVEQFNLAIETYTRVTRITPLPTGGFEVASTPALFPASPEVLTRADKVILVTGGTAAPNRLNIPGEDLPHVSHYFQDPHAYFRKTVLVVGGRNSAVEAALRCHRAGARVAFSYRGAQVDAKDIKYWLYPEFTSFLKNNTITPHLATQITHIDPTHVTLESESGTRTIPADFVLLMTGYHADMSLAQSAGVTLTGDQLMPAFDPATMQTNIPGLYVAGTAIAGTQRRYRVFLENCHVHVDRIVNHLRGLPPPADIAPAHFDRPES